jgi:hypothetical protein
LCRLVEARARLEKFTEDVQNQVLLSVLLCFNLLDNFHSFLKHLAQAKQIGAKKASSVTGVVKLKRFFQMSWHFVLPVSRSTCIFQVQE